MLDFDLGRCPATVSRLVVATVSHGFFQQPEESAFEIGKIDAVLRTLGAGHTRLHRGEIEVDVRAVVDCSFARHAEHLLCFEVGAEGGALLVCAPGGAQVIDRLFVDREITHGRPVFRRHVGDRRPVGQWQ